MRYSRGQFLKHSRGNSFEKIFEIIRVNTKYIPHNICNNLTETENQAKTIFVWKNLNTMQKDIFLHYFKIKMRLKCEKYTNVVVASLGAF